MDVPKEAVEGRWNQQMVFAAVVKEEVDGKEVFKSRIKQGMSYSYLTFVNIFGSKTLHPKPLENIPKYKHQV